MLDFKNLHNPPSPHLTNFILVAPQHSTPCGQSWLLIASYYAYLLPAYASFSQSLRHTLSSMVEGGRLWTFP